MIKRTGFPIGLILVWVFPLGVFGQLMDPVTFEVTGVPDSAAAGSVFDIEVEALIDDTWHLYSIRNDPDAGPYPTQFSAANSRFMLAGDVTESEASVEYDPNFDTELGWHSRQARFTIPIAFRPDLSGTQLIELDVFYQACDSISCLPPRTKSIASPIRLILSDDDIYEGFEGNSFLPAGKLIKIIFLFSVILLISIALIKTLKKIIRKPARLS